MPTNTDFVIPKDGYLAFDALTIKQFIKDRLNETNLFTDQNYEGSYISTMNEITAYMYNLLLYYLSRNSTGNQFSRADLYENMSQIVKLIDYKPVGKQSSTLTFQLTAGSNFAEGLYTIPRYSYIENGTKTFSFNEDITFAKTLPLGTIEALDDVSSQKLLYQGRYREYPLYTAVGNDNELIFFAPGDNVLVDHFNIDIYVKQSDGIWRQWKRVVSLYLENAFNESYEIRLNENKRYEIKFGNGINGKKLEVNDQVQIYYLESSGTGGEVGVHSLQGRIVVPFTTKTFNEILTDISEQTSQTFLYLDSTEAKYLEFDNITISSYYQAEEDVESIRQNAPGVFRSQYRLVTEQDYENYIKSNFANIIHDVKVVNNWTYLTEQVKYYYEDIGLKDPNNVSNLLYNQLNFADSCNFNNVYITVVPKTISNTKNPTANLTPSQKSLIISSMKSVKTLTSETIILDPVFIGVDICISSNGTSTGNIEDINNTELYIEKSSTSRRDNNSIILDISNIFNNYFSRDNMNLGTTLDVMFLTNSILSVDGVKTFYTRRTDNNSISYNGLSLLVWNPIYPNDKTITTKNLAMPYFKYLYLNDRDNFINKIDVSTTTKIYENIEY